MPLLLIGLIGTGGALLGSLLNNATAPAPVITPQEAQVPYVSSRGKAALYAAGAFGIVILAKKFAK